MINYTIIIPHKNIPHLLERCLKSIPERDDIQVIVVDDDSTVGTQLCERPDVEFIFAKDPKRHGAGYARNIGLEHARGKWLIFADADDFFNPCFEEALDKYVDNESDMICFSSNSVNSDNIAISLKNEWYSMGERIKTAIEQHNIDIIRYDTGVVWARFIKHDLVEKIGAKFQETMVRNDTFFAVQIGCASKDIIIDDTLEIYCYTRRDNSLMSKETATDKKERYFVSKTVMRYLRKQKKGFTIFNDDLLYYWNNLGNIDFLYYIKKLPEVYYLTTTKKEVIGNFMSQFKKVLKKSSPKSNYQSL